MKLLLISAIVFMSIQLNAQNIPNNTYITANPVAINYQLKQPSFKLMEGNRIKIELPEGKKKQRDPLGRGAWIGALTGAGLGFTTGLVLFEPCPSGDCLLGPNSAFESGLLVGFFGTLSGAIIGTITGGIIKLIKYGKL